MRKTWPTVFTDMRKKLKINMVDLHILIWRKEQLQQPRQTAFPYPISFFPNIWKKLEDIQRTWLGSGIWDFATKLIHQPEGIFWILQTKPVVEELNHTMLYLFVAVFEFDKPDW